MADPIVIRTLKVVDKKNNNQEYKLTIEGLAQNPHTHTISEITDFNSNNFAPAAHTHTVSEIEGLNINGNIDLSNYLTKDEANLDYAAEGHTHSFAQITDKPGSYTPSSHTHSITNIYVNDQPLTADTYVASGSVTTSIGNDTTSTLIPTVGAIINYINSLDGDIVGFGGQP